MQRLLSDAQAISGVEYDISSYADVVDAIHVIQTKMGITGTTAKEASKTISGSIKAMKSSFSNLIAGLGNEDADLTGLTNQFVTSFETAADNVMPRLEIILEGMAKVIEKVIPIITAKLPSMAKTLLPPLIKAAGQLLVGLAQALPAVLQVLLEMAPFIMEQIGEALIVAFPALLETIKTLFGMIWDYIFLEVLDTRVSFEDALSKMGEIFDTAWSTMQQVWTDVALPMWQSIQDKVALFLPTVEETFAKVKETFSTAWGTILAKWEEVGLPMWQSIQDKVKLVLPVIEETLAKVKEGFGTASDWISSKFDLLWAKCVEKWEAVGQPVFDIIKETFSYLYDNAGKIFDNLSEKFSYLWDVFSEVWGLRGQIIFDTIATVLNVLSENWDTIMSTISTLFETAWDICTTAWETIGQPIFDIIQSAVGKVLEIFEENMPKIIKVFSEVVDTISKVWETILKPVFVGIGQYINDELKPAFENTFDLIAKIVSGAFDLICLTWDEVLKPLFDGICDFVTNVFAGNWSGAWESIVGTFETVFGGLVDVAKVPINAVIGYVNKAIDAINGLSFTVPDWVPGIGGENFGFNIPSIPALANGGVLEKGQVGLLEGSGAEAVVPLENNHKWISRVAEDMESATGNDALLREIIDVLHDIRSILPEEIADAVANLKFEISNREFARLVKAVN